MERESDDSIEIWRGAARGMRRGGAHSREKWLRGGYLFSIAVSTRKLQASFDLIDGVTLQARQSRTLPARKRIDFEELKEVT